MSTLTLWPRCNVFCFVEYVQLSRIRRNSFQVTQRGTLQAILSNKNRVRPVEFCWELILACSDLFAVRKSNYKHLAHSRFIAKVNTFEIHVEWTFDNECADLPFFPTIKRLPRPGCFEARVNTRTYLHWVHLRDFAVSDWSASPRIFMNTVCVPRYLYGICVLCRFLMLGADDPLPRKIKYMPMAINFNSLPFV